MFAMKNIPILLLVFLSQALYAQQAEIKWGDKLNNTDNPNLTFVKKDPITQQSYWISKQKNKWFIFTFDNNNICIRTKEINLQFAVRSDTASGFAIYQALPFRNRILFWVSYFNIKSGLQGECICQVSLDGLVQGKVTDVSMDSTIPLDSMMYTINMGMKLSPDSSKILVYHKIPFVKSNNLTSQILDKEIYILHILDQDLNILYKKNIRVSFFNSDIRAQKKWTSDQIQAAIIINYVMYTSLLIDNNAAVYFMNIETASGINNPFMTIHIYDPVTDIYQVQVLDSIHLNDIRELAILTNRSGIVIVTGFYLKNIDNKSNGIFYCTIDPKTSTPLQVTIQPIKELTNITYEYYDVQLIPRIQYLSKNDGGFVMIYENYSYSFANNLSVININANGSIEYVKTIEKKQKVSSQNVYSYYASYNEDTKSVLIVYNDNPQNKTNVQPDKMYSMTPNEAIPIVCSIDSLGKISEYSLKDTFTSKIIPCPGSFVKVNDDEIILLGRDGTSVSIGSLRFNTLAGK